MIFDHGPTLPYWTYAERRRGVARRWEDVVCVVGEAAATICESLNDEPTLR
jgi:hypothetical protein